MVNPLTRCVEDYSLPPFAQLRETDIVPALRAAMAELALDLNAIEDDLSDPDADLTWESVMDRLEIIDDPLNRLWRIVIHLSSVANSPELRAAKAEVQAEVVTIQSRRAQSVEVFRAMNKLRSSPAFDTYTIEQQRILDRAILAATLSGVALSAPDRARCNQINIRLNELANVYSDNILDGTKAFSHIAHERSEVDGLPDSLLALLAQNAVAAGHQGATGANGPWKLSLEFSVYLPVMKFCRNRATRQLVFNAHAAKSAVPPCDNTPIMDEILRLRHELALLVGLASYAELSLLDKTAPSVSAVEDLIDDLRDKCLPISTVEMAEVADFASSHGQLEPLEACDTAFWSEQLRQAHYHFDDEQLKPYFPMAKVLSGLFDFALDLFGIRVEPADGEEEAWHPDVRFFQMRAVELPGEPVIAQFFMDPYARPGNKRNGGWIEVVVSRSKVLRTEKAAVRRPVFALMSTQTPPVGDSPVLMSCREVEQLFHNFGYGLRIALTSAEYTAASRPHGVEWDAVEIPSKFMANMCYSRRAIALISGHYETGEPLPDHLLDKVVAARQFMAATTKLAQLRTSALDLELHHRYDLASTESIYDVQYRVSKAFSVLPPVPRDTRLCNLPHIFSGLYAAAYYSYLWSEVFATDALAAFAAVEETDVDEWRALGRSFRDNVFALLGVVHPMDAFKRFRGRQPSTDALLERYGLK